MSLNREAGPSDPRDILAQKTKPLLGILPGKKPVNKWGATQDLVPKRGQTRCLILGSRWWGISMERWILWRIYHHLRTSKSLQPVPCTSHEGHTLKLCPLLAEITKSTSATSSASDRPSLRPYVATQIVGFSPRVSVAGACLLAYVEF
jgi:hypothetical protein